MNPSHDDLSFPSYPKTKVIASACFKVRFVSADNQTLIRIFSKATGNKRVNNVFRLCSDDLNKSSARNIVEAFTFLSAFSKFFHHLGT